MTEHILTVSEHLYLHSSGSRSPLRIGLLVDDLRLIRVFEQVTRHVVASNFATIALVVRNATPEPQRPRRSRLASYLDVLRTPQKRRGILYDQYLKVDHRLAGAAEDPLALVDCRDLLGDVPRLDVEPITSRFVHRFPEAALQRIREADLDVLLRFGFNILRGPILTAARYGIWSFHHGDNDFYRGGPAMFWELREQAPTTGVILQVLTEDLDAGEVLSKAVFPTRPGLSLARNRFGPYWASTDMVIQKLRELHEHGWEYVRSRSVPPQPYRGTRTIYRTPTNAEMIQWLVPAVTRKAVGHVARRFQGSEHAEWRIGLRSDRSLLDEGAAYDLTTFRWIPPPADGYLADPFVFTRDGRLWLFAEEYEYGKGKARLVVSELRDGVEPGDWRVCLDRPYHLSYPHVFEHGGDIFMVPETRNAGEVQLYRAHDFPVGWRLERVLFRANAVDTTLWCQDGRWWCFLTMVDARAHVPSLLLFHAQRLTGPWTPHPANPISRDARNARGAGAVFEQGGRLYRPSQDSSSRYGYAFAVNEITKLDPLEYREQPAVTVLPAAVRDLLGTHTYNRAGQVEAIDGEFRVGGRRTAAGPR